MRILLVITTSIALVACGHQSESASTTTTATTTAAASADTGAADFPPGTQLGELGLPVYPTPKGNVVVNAPETNGAGEKSASVSMDPHVAIGTVIAWYKERMPGDSYVESGNPDYASFRIGKDGDKVIRSVIIQHVAGHVQTDIILTRKTLP